MMLSHQLLPKRLIVMYAKYNYLLSASAILSIYRCMQNKQFALIKKITYEDLAYA